MGFVFRFVRFTAWALRGYRFIFAWSGLVWPGLVARSRWPGPAPVARSRWPGAGGPTPPFFAPVPAQVLAVCPARWPGPGPGPGSGGPIPLPSRFVPVARSRSRWPGPSPNKADHLCSVASFNVSRHGCAISSRNMVVLRCSPNHW